jgi:hypothetical protein
MGKLPDAIASYTKAREQCRDKQYYGTWKSVIDKQITIYANANMAADVRLLEAERELVEGLELESSRGHA